jgi:hypothetical protein
MDHLDVDGLLAAFVFTTPDVALEFRALLEKMAHAGDFGFIRASKDAQLDSTAIQCWYVEQR